MRRRSPTISITAFYSTGGISPPKYFLSGAATFASVTRCSPPCSAFMGRSSSAHRNINIARWPDSARVGANLFSPSPIRRKRFSVGEGLVQKRIWAERTFSILPARSNLAGPSSRAARDSSRLADSSPPPAGIIGAQSGQADPSPAKMQAAGIGSPPTPPAREKAIGECLYS